MAYTLTMEERETHIRWDAAEKVAHIFTADPVSVRKLDKLVSEFPETYKLVRADNYGGKFYEVSNKYIRFGKPASEARRNANKANGSGTFFTAHEHGELAI